MYYYEYLLFYFLFQFITIFCKRTFLGPPETPLIAFYAPQKLFYTSQKPLIRY